MLWRRGSGKLCSRFVDYFMHITTYNKIAGIVFYIALLYSNLLLPHIMKGNNEVRL